MALSKDLLCVCEVNRIMLDHLDFHCDLEVDEELIEPAEIPRRITEQEEAAIGTISAMRKEAAEHEKKLHAVMLRTA